jgi:nicotinate-nucleotide--dimethylbenzimidazole phosphoribosyltransferase
LVVAERNFIYVGFYPLHTAVFAVDFQLPNYPMNPNLQTMLNTIKAPDPIWRQQAQQHLDQLTKPLGSLGRLEDVAAQIVSIQQTMSPSVGAKSVYVFAADHGVVEEGVSAYPSEVTRQMVLNFLNGGAAINAIARKAQANVIVVDAGVDADFADHPGLVQRKVRRGTRNMLHTPAMTDDEVYAALQIGIDLAESAKGQGINLIAVGEMGIGNTTSASAITAALTGQPAGKVTGAGAGLEPQAVSHKARVVEGVLQKHGLSGAPALDALHVLRCVGGLEIAAIAGMVLASASLHIACVIDGFISTAAAALAHSLQPQVREYLFAGHQSEEPGHKLLLNMLGLSPLLTLNMRLGEGTGAVLAFHLIEVAVNLFNEMATFAQAKVSGATP